MENKNFTYEEILDRDGVLIYKTSGTSMLPMLHENRDLIVIEKYGERRPQKYDVVLFRRPAQYVLHRILEVRDSDYIIVGDNLLTRESVKEEQILGVLTHFVRKGKEYKVTDENYLRYVHLWCDHMRFRKTVLFLERVKNGILRRVKKLFRGKKDE